MKSYNIAEIKNIPLTNFIELRDGLNENCPFCDHKDHFYFNKAKNTYRSFNSCCRGGSIIDFIMESRGLNFTDSVNWLGDYYNVDSEKLEIQNKATVNRLKRINLHIFYLFEICR
jgi:DNA primase